MKIAHAVALVLLAVAPACKRKPPPTTSVATPEPTMTPEQEARSRAEKLTPHAFLKVCDGKPEPWALPAEGLRANTAVFLSLKPGAEFAELDPDKIIAGLLASYKSTPTVLVACYRVTKLTKIKECAFSGENSSHRTNLNKVEYTLTLREAKTATVLSEEKNVFAPKKCPDVHFGEKHDYKLTANEDEQPPYQASIALAVDKWQNDHPLKKPK